MGPTAGMDGSGDEKHLLPLPALPTCPPFTLSHLKRLSSAGMKTLCTNEVEIISQTAEVNFNTKIWHTLYDNLPVSQH
jgi:hypothetical protein